MDDHEQGRGLGTIMLEYLAAAALEHGIHRFVAWVAQANTKMLAVFADAGFDVRRNVDGGTVEITFDIEPTPGSIEARTAHEHASESRSIARAAPPDEHRRHRGQSGTRLDRTRGLPQPRRRRVHRSGLSGEPARRFGGGRPGLRVACATSPTAVDLAVIVTPAAAVLDVVEECAAAGVGGLVVISAGFAEVEGGRPRA